MAGTGARLGLVHSIAITCSGPESGTQLWTRFDLTAAGRNGCLAGATHKVDANDSRLLPIRASVPEKARVYLLGDSPQPRALGLIVDQLGVEIVRRELGIGEDLLITERKLRTAQRRTATEAASEAHFGQHT